MMDLEPDESELARRARDGDREALAELVERARLPLFALAYAELRHYQDAEDAVAAALLQVCRHVGELREPERVRAWMQSIARNEALQIRRRRVSAPLSMDAEEASRGTGDWRLTPGADAGASLLRLDIERALRQLPRDEARALALFYLSRLPIDEIARRVGRPEGTIKRWLHQGRRRLAAEMEGYAPMTPSTPAAVRSAAILSTDLEPAVLQGLIDAMKAVGWDEVTVLGAVPVVELPVGSEEIRLSEPLRGKRFLVLDDSVGGHSAFELHILLKACAAATEITFGLLSSSGAESTVRAAWLAGFDLFLTKPVDPAEFGRFSQRILEKLTAGG
jgi:RNA polymerase sigma-70 factor (ECF subfamily)